MDHLMRGAPGGGNHPSRHGKINKLQPPRPCPRCYSGNTKFAYFNNRSPDQLRYYCMGCMRHWTHGGTLRNIPFGSGKRRRSKRPSEASTSQQPPFVAPMTVPGPQFVGENYDAGLFFMPFSPGSQPLDPFMDLLLGSYCPPNFEPHPTDPLFQRIYSSYEREISGSSSSEAKPDAPASSETKNDIGDDEHNNNEGNKSDIMGDVRVDEP